MLQRGGGVQRRARRSPAAGDGCQLELPTPADASKSGAEIRRLGPRVGGEDEQRLRATAAFAPEGLPQELYVELLGFTLPRWADKGPEA